MYDNTANSDSAGCNCCSQDHGWSQSRSVDHSTVSNPDSSQQTRRDARHRSQLTRLSQTESQMPPKVDSQIQVTMSVPTSAIRIFNSPPHHSREQQTGRRKHYAGHELLTRQARSLWRNRRRIREEAQQMMHRKRTIHSQGSTCLYDRECLCGLTARAVHVCNARSSGRGVLETTKWFGCLQSVYCNGKRFALCATNLCPCKPAEGER